MSTRASTSCTSKHKLHEHTLPEHKLHAREDARADLQFQATETLKGPLYDSLESWSRFCVDTMDEF